MRHRKDAGKKPQLYNNPDSPQLVIVAHKELKRCAFMYLRFNSLFLKNSSHVYAQIVTTHVLKIYEHYIMLFDCSILYLLCSLWCSEAYMIAVYRATRMSHDKEKELRMTFTCPSTQHQNFFLGVKFVSGSMRTILIYQLESCRPYVLQFFFSFYGLPYVSSDVGKGGGVITLPLIYIRGNPSHDQMMAMLMHVSIRHWTLPELHGWVLGCQKYYGNSIRLMCQESGRGQIQGYWFLYRSTPSQF